MQNNQLGFSKLTLDARRFVDGFHVPKAKLSVVVAAEHEDSARCCHDSGELIAAGNFDNGVISYPELSRLLVVSEKALAER